MLFARQSVDDPIVANESVKEKPEVESRRPDFGVPADESTEKCVLSVPARNLDWVGIVYQTDEAVPIRSVEGGRPFRIFGGVGSGGNFQVFKSTCLRTAADISAS